MERSISVYCKHVNGRCRLACLAILLVMTACDTRLPPPAADDGDRQATGSTVPSAAMPPGASQATAAASLGDVSAGEAALVRFGCGSCHTIPGVRGADALVGPPLNKWSRRTFIAGRLPNTPQNLVHWIVTPQTVEPGTAMPNLGVSEREARDMAAYLYTLK